MGVRTTQVSDGDHQKSIGCWRPLAGASSMTSGPVNVVLEPNVKLKPEHIESRGADFEKSAEGFIDFLLPGDDGKPLIVLEAKSEDKSYSPTCKRIRAF